MNALYPYIEYMKVFVAYIALLYIWPSIIFRKFLRGKGLTLRFAFCSTISIALINVIISFMALFHILNIYVVRILFWGTLFISVVFPIVQNSMGDHANILVDGKYGRRQVRIRLLKVIIKNGKNFWETYKGRLTEFLVLCAIILYGMTYISYGSIQHYSYGCYDQYTHYNWIMDLKQGKIFVEGIYPEAMHCFIYSMHILFGVKLHSCVLFLAGIHISAFLVSSYCLMKEVFQCRYTPLFVLTVWITFDGGIENVLEAMYMSMTRLTWTLPQEFGLYLVFLCPLFLLRYFRMKKINVIDGRWFKNENMLLLMMGIAAAISIHFYVVILAFFACIPVVIVYLRQFLTLRKIKTILCAIGSGIGIGAGSLIIAYFMGFNLQGSLWWGISRYNGTSGDAVKSYSGNSNLTTARRNIIEDIYEKGYVAIFGEHTAKGLLADSLFIIVVLCACLVFIYVRRRAGHKEKMIAGVIINRYFYVVFVSMIYVLLYAAPYIGLPEFVAVDRIFSVLKMFVFAVPWVIIDCIFFLCFFRMGEKYKKFITVIGCIIICCYTYNADFHEYMYCVMKRYNEAVLVTDEIMERFHKNSYMIISTKDEKGQLAEIEKHEDILEFIENTEEKEYYLPAEYIFVYVEKKPLVQGQIHYFTGPLWLAKRSSIYPSKETESQCPDFLHTEITWEMSQQSMPEGYFDAVSRTILNSKVYYWYQDFSASYPAETSTYFEDDNFVCYLIHQELESPLNLASNKESETR